MVAFHVAEVIRTGPLLFGENQVDDKGNVLPLGTVKVRITPRDGVSNVKDVYARPMTHVVSNPPLIGEQVLIFNGPTENASPHVREQGWYYFPFPINTTDDVANNSTPQSTFRSKKRKFAIPPKPITLDLALGFRNRPISVMQSFVQDSLLQSRTGGAIRLGGTTLPHPQYANQPQHHKEGKLGDANFAMTLEESGPIKPRDIAEQIIPAIKNLDPTLKQFSQKYRIDDMSRVATGIYAGLSQKYPKIRCGRSCLPITKTIPKFNKPQIVMDSSRIVMNAKEDHAFFLAKKTAAMEGKKIHFVTDRHNVDFDTLMDNIIDLSRQVMKIATAQAPLATVMGPTGFALNFAQLIKIYLNFLRFATIPCNPLTFPKVPNIAPSYDFGLNTFKAAARDRSLEDSVKPSNVSKGVGSSCSPSGIPTQIPGDGKVNPEEEIQDELQDQPQESKCYRYRISNKEDESQTLVYKNCTGETKQRIIQRKSQVLEGVCITKVIERGTLELTLLDTNCDIEELTETPPAPVEIEISEPDTCQGYIYEFTGTQLNALVRTSTEIQYTLLLISGKGESCQPGWYLVSIEVTETIDRNSLQLLTNNVLADDICLRDALQDLKCGNNVIIVSPQVSNKSIKVQIK